MNYRDFLQKVIYVMINPLIKAMIKIGITPNIVTLVGFIGNILAMLSFTFCCATLGTSTRLTLYSYLKKILGPHAQKVYNLVWSLSYRSGTGRDDPCQKFYCSNQE